VHGALTPMQRSKNKTTSNGPRLPMTEERSLHPHGSPLELLALGLVTAGVLGSALVVTSNLHDAEIVGGTWGAIGVIGWWLPLVAAALLVVGALVGLAAAFVASLTAYYVGGPTFGQCFFWEFLLPVATALLFVAAHRQRTGRPAMW
jgi:hypothetical protein